MASNTTRVNFSNLGSAGQILNLFREAGIRCHISQASLNEIDLFPPFHTNINRHKLGRLWNKYVAEFDLIDMPGAPPIVKFHILIMIARVRDIYDVLKTQDEGNYQEDDYSPQAASHNLDLLRRHFWNIEEMEIRNQQANQRNRARPTGESRPSTTTATQPTGSASNRPQIHDQCLFCGGAFHDGKDGILKCPATGVQCTRCKFYNHYTHMCLKTQPELRNQVVNRR